MSEEIKMDKRKVKKRIKEREKRYMDCCDKINKESNIAIKNIKVNLDVPGGINDFRKKSVLEIFKLKDKDEEILRLRKLVE